MGRGWKGLETELELPIRQFAVGVDALCELIRK
jgi:hypothetical protein